MAYPALSFLIFSSISAVVMSGCCLAIKIERWNLDETDDWGFKVLLKFLNTPSVEHWLGTRWMWRVIEKCCREKETLKKATPEEVNGQRVLLTMHGTWRGSVCSSIKEMHLYSLGHCDVAIGPFKWPRQVGLSMSGVHIFTGCKLV